MNHLLILSVSILLGGRLSSFSRVVLKQQQTACYVLNTGYFDDKKSNLKRHCQSLKESCNKRQEIQVVLVHLKDIHYLPIPDFPVSFEDTSYKDLVKQRLDIRFTIH